MWSDRYYYLNIYKDNLLSKDFPTNKLSAFLSTIPELQKCDEYNYKNKEPFPFVSLCLLELSHIGSWSSHDSNITTNFIAIECAKGNPIEFKEIEKVLIKIALFLKWNLVDEETDDGIENQIIWKP